MALPHQNHLAVTLRSEFGISYCNVHPLTFEAGLASLAPNRIENNKLSIKSNQNRDGLRFASGRGKILGVLTLPEN
jgi:hypothetical protein